MSDKILMNISMILKKEDFVKIKNQPTGKIQLAQKEDWFFLKEWIELFYEEALGQNFLIKNNSHKKEFNEKPQIYLWWDKKPVAMGMITTDLGATAKINLIYTIKSERGKGYGKAIVYELCKIILEDNKTPTLSVSSGNIAAKNLYYSIGFNN